jgi:hypothetical protein
VTAYDDLSLGKGFAPPRLAREDVASLRTFSRHARLMVWNALDPEKKALRLHGERNNERKLALAKLGHDAPHVLVESTRKQVFSEVNVLVVMPGDDRRYITNHRFQRRASTKEWVRVLARHCRHAFGVLTLLGRTELRAKRPAARASERPSCVESS